LVDTVYSGADHELYEKALKFWGIEAQRLKAIEEMSELSVVISKMLNGYTVSETAYLGELIDAQLLINQLVHNELGNPSYWMLKRQKIERLKMRVINEEYPT
jgi:predicted nucleic acid-binding protein